MPSPGKSTSACRVNSLGPTKTSRSGDSRRAPALMERRWKTACWCCRRSDRAALRLTSSAGAGGSGSEEEGWFRYPSFFSMLSTLVIHRRPGHGKTLGPALLRNMLRRFLHSDGFRPPQFAAAALLLVYLLQCVWLVRVQTLHALDRRIPTRALRIYQGLEQWKGGAIAGTPESLRSEAATGRAFCRPRRSSPRARRLRSGSLATLLPGRCCAAFVASRLRGCRNRSGRSWRRLRICSSA